jgi:predicted RNase H-like HicB family nuclease
VLYTFDGRWWTAEAPFLRGAYSQGRTRGSARRNLLAAIHDLLETYRSLGQSPRLTKAVQVEIADLAG